MELKTALFTMNILNMKKIDDKCGKSSFYLN